MKLDRRSFISLGVGATAGLTLSPLPWKLVDDLSIWSQNWPWTPVPPDGKTTYVNTVCTLCPGGCGITVRKIEDRVVKIEGMKGHPVNDGGICILGLAGPQLQYTPTRVDSPHIKEKRKWKAVSWEKALKEITDKLNQLKEKGQTHKVACLLGPDQGTVSALFERFMKAFGSPNIMRTPSINDSYALAINRLQGVEAFPAFDFENADFILSFGSGIIDGWGSPVRMFKANSIWKTSHVKTVQVEPCLSNTAAKSDQWIPINPGTETALALGLAHVIINESLYNADFIGRCSGFNAFKQAVQEYPPEKVSRITGIKKADMISLARKFAHASSPLAICGRGQGRTPEGVTEIMAVHALNALTGNINKKGGVSTVSTPDDYINWPAISSRINTTGYRLNRLPKILSSGEECPVEVLFISGANPYYTMPDTENVKKAFERIDLKVSFSTYWDETTENADIVLPNHSYLERFEDVPVAAGLNRPIIGMLRPVVKPQLQTRHTGDVIIRLAKSMGGSIAQAFPWDAYTTCLKSTMGNNWTDLMKKGYIPAPEKSGLSSSRKFEFPAIDKKIEQVIQPEGDDLFPLTLIPKDSMRIAGGDIGSPPFLIKTVEDTVLKKSGKTFDVFVDINPETAKQYGLSEGCKAEIKTPIGKGNVRVHLFEGMMPGVIAMPRGLGHTAYDEYLAGKGINFNSLIATVEDPESGLDAAWGIKAKLTRA